MVVLVRCCDNTCTLALESRLMELISEGLVVEVLCDDVWVNARRFLTPAESLQPMPVRSGMTALLTSI